MYIHGYLRASTKEQDALRAKNRMKAFVEEKGFRMASWYTENVSGASLQRPELLRLLDDTAPGDIILIEQVDRLSRLDEAGWQKLKHLIQEKRLVIVSLDLPTSHTVFSVNTSDQFTKNMLNAINGMMLDMLAAIARKDYEDRRRRQEEGITKAKAAGKFKGRQADQLLHNKIIELRVKNKYSIRDTASLCGVSDRTVIRVVKNAKSKQSQNE
ncbi:serine recombinase (plasmid) [Yersinia enterocolitica]|uniref:Resolvase n=1 Tax=Yersinia enterocolitica TaxID=630 RepID=A0ABM9S622_YEREN|nr:recombinase family protein [Yersinia enterocolitica]AOF17283.1 serine recombinase [Yersinia enterocolitica]AOF25396.1 serine recombinase [Yersinia enterocolitica]AOF25467.1 serine recombinase [Yersinia enterocolitica]AOF29468.1 serine recombinase [Yersinia enterocolitica]AOF29552.1 serine recombinase [Yersinia enterocolitica]